MLQHFFKLIWNRKKTNFMTSLGIFISFIVLFLVMSTIVYNIDNYVKPLGFDYKDVWYISMDWKDTSTEDKLETLRQIKTACHSFQQIESFTFSHAFILTPSVMSMSSYEYEGKELRLNIRHGGDNFADLLDVDIIEGRWFNETDNVSNQNPVIINKVTKEEFFGIEPAVGKTILRGDDEYSIVGVINEFRNGGRFTGSSSKVFHRLALDNEQTMYSFVSEPLGSRILLKMKPGVDPQFEEILTKHISDIASNWQIRVNSLESIKKSADTQTLVVPIILAVICGFLIINVALGLFGVIWYNTNRRRSEIGLRRALGSSAANIYKQILGESLVLTTIAVFFASLFALQFPLLGLLPFFTPAVYTVSYIISLIIIFLLTSLCALYPSRIAASIQPADSLHYE